MLAQKEASGPFCRVSLVGRIAEHWGKQDHGVFLRVGLPYADVQCHLQKGALLKPVWPRRLLLISFPSWKVGWWWRFGGGGVWGWGQRTGPLSNSWSQTRKSAVMRLGEE